jgi:ligand-binding SRPBCC domain-containing protein
LIHHAQFEDWVPFPVERVFLFFANPHNLPRLMPPETTTRIDKLQLVPPSSPSPNLSPSSPIAGVGSEIYTSFRILPLLPFRATWIARITEFEWNHHFADIQAKGPFHSWHHRHEFAPEIHNGIAGTLVRDQIDYSVGFGPFGAAANQLFVSRQLRHTFQRRQEALPGLLRTF